MDIEERVANPELQARTKGKIPCFVDTEQQRWSKGVDIRLRPEDQHNENLYDKGEKAAGQESVHL